MKCRSFRKFDEKLFVEDLEYVHWNLCEVFDDPNEALDCWQKLVLDVVDKHVPVQEHRVKRSSQAT